MTRKQVDELQQLKIRKSKADAEFQRVTKELVELKQTHCQVRAKVVRLTDKIKSATPKKRTVSDHALIRYIERFMDYPVEEIRQTILDRCTELLPKGLDHGVFPFPPDGLVVIKGNTIVTFKGNTNDRTQ